MDRSSSIALIVTVNVISLVNMAKWLPLFHSALMCHCYYWHFTYLVFAIQHWSCSWSCEKFFATCIWAWYMHVFVWVMVFIRNILGDFYFTGWCDLFTVPIFSNKALISWRIVYLDGSFRVVTHLRNLLTVHLIPWHFLKSLMIGLTTSGIQWVWLPKQQTIHLW